MVRHLRLEQIWWRLLLLESELSALMRVTGSARVSEGVGMTMARKRVLCEDGQAGNLKKINGQRVGSVRFRWDMMGRRLAQSVLRQTMVERVDGDTGVLLG